MTEFTQALIGRKVQLTDTLLAGHTGSILKAQFDQDKTAWMFTIELDDSGRKFLETEYRVLLTGIFSTQFIYL